MYERAQRGWDSDFPTFRETSTRVITGSLRQFIRDASPEQLTAWDQTVPPLQQ